MNQNKNHISADEELKDLISEFQSLVDIAKVKVRRLNDLEDQFEAMRYPFTEDDELIKYGYGTFGGDGLGRVVLVGRKRATTFGIELMKHLEDNKYRTGKREMVILSALSNLLIGNEYFKGENQKYNYEFKPLDKCLSEDRSYKE